jgi:hypothetical protein
MLADSDTRQSARRKQVKVSGTRHHHIDTSACGCSTYPVVYWKPRLSIIRCELMHPTFACISATCNKSKCLMLKTSRDPQSPNFRYLCSWPASWAMLRLANSPSTSIAVRISNQVTHLKHADAPKFPHTHGSVSQTSRSSALSSMHTASNSKSCHSFSEVHAMPLATLSRRHHNGGKHFRRKTVT